MNAASSRSHAVLILSVKQSSLDDEEGSSGDGMDIGTIHSKIALVDLAGSERAKSTGAAGQRLKVRIAMRTVILILNTFVMAEKKALAGRSRKRDVSARYKSARTYKCIQLSRCVLGATNSNLGAEQLFVVGTNHCNQTLIRLSGNAWAMAKGFVAGETREFSALWPLLHAYVVSILLPSTQRANACRKEPRSTKASALSGT